MPMFAILKKAPDFWRPLTGYMDEQGTVLIEPQFLQNPSSFSDHFSTAGHAIVQRPDNRKHIVINTIGETVFEFPPDHQPVSETLPDENGIFGVMHQVDASNKDLWKTEGRDRYFVGETRYFGMRLDGSVAFDGYLTHSVNGYYKVSASWRQGEKCGVMNGTGDYVIPPIYDHIYLSRTSPYATVLNGDRTNVVAMNGEQVFPHDFTIGGLTQLREVVDGHWVVPNAKDRRADVYDVATKDVIGHLPMTFWSPSISTACPTLSGGVACINHPSKGSTYYHPDGRAVMPGILGRPRWFNADMRTGYFYQGRASFKLGDLWGYMDLAGKHVIEPQFHSDLPFRDGLARVRYPSDGRSWDRYSYIDRDGRVVWHQEQ